MGAEVVAVTLRVVNVIGCAVWMLGMVVGEGRIGAGVAWGAGCVRQESAMLLSLGYVMVGLVCVASES